MFLYQTISCRRAFPQVAGLTLLLALGLASSGCSSWPWHHHDSDAAPEAPKAAAPASAGSSVAAEPQTVTSNLPDVPDSDTTHRGDRDHRARSTRARPRATWCSTATRSGASPTRFLQDPWLWPEIWYVNPEVSNPHRIYPGDTLRLATGKDGKQQVQVVHAAGSATKLEPLLRSTELEAPIANIPYSTIAAFLSARRAQQEAGRGRALCAGPARSAHDRGHRQRHLREASSRPASASIST